MVYEAMHLQAAELAACLPSVACALRPAGLKEHKHSKCSNGLAIAEWYQPRHPHCYGGAGSGRHPEGVHS